MDEWKKGARRDVVIIVIDALVPKDHLLRSIGSFIKFRKTASRAEGNLQARPKMIQLRIYSKQHQRTEG